MNLFLDIWQDSLDERSARRKAPTCTGQHNTEKREHTSMPRAEFEPTVPVFERLKTVSALYCAAIGTGNWSVAFLNYFSKKQDRKCCDIYRGNIILSSGYEISSMILSVKLKVATEVALGKEVRVRTICLR
jgi:hypothetical protein